MSGSSSWAGSPDVEVLPDALDGESDGQAPGMTGDGLLRIGAGNDGTCNGNISRVGRKFEKEIVFKECPWNEQGARSRNRKL